MSSPDRAATPFLARFHAGAGGLALALIASFWTATVAVETLGSTAAVIAVKMAIPLGFLILVPALAAAGVSGARLARGRLDARTRRKQWRLRLAALNGVVILIPTALLLAARARAGQLDVTFAALQALELVAGAANIVLLASNLREGLAMRRARRERATAAAARLAALLVAVVVCGCGAPHLGTVREAEAALRGAPSERLLACIGTPAEMVEGVAAARWIYASTQPRQADGRLGGPLDLRDADDACVFTFTIVDDRIVAIDSENRAGWGGGSIRACAAVVERCAP